jgi:hypothetical protein
LSQEGCTYKPGNILLIHLQHSKTKKIIAEEPCNYNNVGKFIRFDHHNVISQLLDANKFIQVPICDTKTDIQNLDVMPFNGEEQGLLMKQDQGYHVFLYHIYFLGQTSFRLLKRTGNAG